jgi:hypothetical protein
MHPKSVDFYNGNLLVGLRNGTIVEYPKVLESSEGTPDSRILVQSHFEGELWGLYVLDDNTLLTGCDDNKVLCYDTDKK